MKHLVETKGKSIYLYFSLMLTIPQKQPEQTCDFEISSAGHLPVNTNPSHKLFDLSQQKSVSSQTGTKGGGGDDGHNTSNLTNPVLLFTST